MSTLKVNTIDSHSGSLLTIDSTADVLVASSTTATSSTTGALKVTGGISTQENLYVGGNAVITGTMTANGGTITLGDAGTDNVTIGGEINSDIIPDVTNTYDLGSAAKKWAEIHATTFTGALTGNVTGNTSGSAGSCTGNSATATALATGRTVGMTGDVVWTSAALDGTGNVTGTAAIQSDTVAATELGVTAGTATALKALVVDASKDINLGTGDLTATVITGALTGNVTGNLTGTASALSGTATITGTPTAPTAAANTNTTQIATTAYVQTELTDLIGSAPAALNTLQELGDALGDDANYAATITTALATKTAKTSNQSLGSAANVMTISGHTITLARGDSTTDTVIVPDNDTTYSVGDGGLTQINFTSADNTKLDAIEASADVTDVTNVTAAGALMDSELAGLAAVKATTGTFLTADQTKLDGIATSANNYTHPTSAGNKHIPTGGASGQFLKYSSSGTAVWAADNNTNTTYTADGNYGMTLSGTTFRLEDDRRRNSSTTDVYSGNTHDYTFYDASLGIRWYTTGVEEMRLEDDGDLHVDGDVVAYSTTVSDERLKTGILPITNALAKVNQLKGCTFTYLSDGRKSAGLIAQDVEKVLPSAVSEKELPLKKDDGEKYKVLQYDQTIGLLVEAIKELSSKIEKLEEK